METTTEATERQTIMPENEDAWLKLRMEDITSTEVSALFGCSPYLTHYELWHRKRDKIVVDFKVNDRMKWGTRLQDAIAEGIAEDQDWSVRPMKEYMRIPGLRMGSSFDFSIEAGFPGLLEVKNVDSLAFRDGWIVEGDNVEAPAHIEFQAQHQMFVSGRSYLYIGALIGGNRVVLIKREPDIRVFEAIKLKVSQFWESIDKGIEPKPNFEKDAEFIISQNAFAEPGKIYDAREDGDLIKMIEEYTALGRTIKTCETAREEIKAKTLIKIGTAEKVVADTFSVSAGIVGPAHVEYDREGYRSFRVFPKKEKK